MKARAAKTAAPVRRTVSTRGPRGAAAQEIAAAELRATEREKVRLSTELHDGVGQHLTGIAFLAKALANRLRAEGAPAARDAEEIARLTNQAIGNIRALARGLRPVGPEDNALTVAVRQLVRDVEQVYGVEVQFGFDEPISIASPEVSHHLYRIAQEGIHNAVKHGGPGVIKVDLAKRGETIALTVTNRGTLHPPDDGPQKDSPGIGIASMRYRAGLIGARMTLESLRKGEVRLKVLVNPDGDLGLNTEGETP